MANKREKINKAAHIVGNSFLLSKMHKCFVTVLLITSTPLIRTRLNDLFICYFWSADDWEKAFKTRDPCKNIECGVDPRQTNKRKFWSTWLATVTASSDHYYHTYSPFIRSHNFQNLIKQNKLPKNIILMGLVNWIIDDKNPSQK